MSFLICGVYNPARSCGIHRISHALLHKCMHFPSAFCLRRLQTVFLRLRMLLLWLPDRECCRSEGLGREAITPLFLHLLSWLCLLFKIWVVFVFQQLQMRLQEKEQEVDDLIIQIQAEKVLPFFCSPLSAPPSSSAEPQIVQNTDLCLGTITL